MLTTYPESDSRAFSDGRLVSKRGHVVWASPIKAAPRADESLAKIRHSPQTATEELGGPAVGGHQMILHGIQASSSNS